MRKGRSDAGLSIQVGLAMSVGKPLFQGPFGVLEDHSAICPGTRRLGRTSLVWYGALPPTGVHLAVAW